ncbi:imm11 family protein [Paenibacillus algorifonticola]|uniref:imm11 family protein n=1 Tax=Paenibacillus algorifonticola TaxID=684063 RepID=UPI000619C5D0|nr:DUF1629 domain-containing protein [Paenibacillus algorifonticola]
MIWIWSIPENWANKRIGEYVENSGADRFIFREARKITEDIIVPKVIFECAEKYLYDVLPNSGSLIIVSENVVEIMEKICPNDIEIFDANVYVGDKKILNYFLINILHAVDILNKDESKYSTIKGTNAILGFDKIVYNHNDIPNHHIVRNADYRSHVLVSDELKEAFEQSKIKGVHFSID